MPQASWSCLGSDLQLSILSSLKQQGDKDAIQAVLQTSRALRILASSLICKLEVCNLAALSCFPWHATVTTIELMMRPLQPSEPNTHMDLPDVLAWLAATSAAGRRLRAVTTLSMIMPYENRQLGASLAALILAVGQAFPNLRSLSVMGLTRSLNNEGPTAAFFQAVGQHLPNITTLRVWASCERNQFNLDIPCIDWAACLPAGLCTILLNVGLHPALLQHLAQMPKLTDVESLSLSKDRYVDSPSIVQAEGCAWRVLKLSEFPSYKEVCSFSTWPRFSLQSQHASIRFSWTLRQHSPEQTLALATAAARLATCSEIAWPDSGFTVIGFNDPLPTEESASIIGVLSALAPLANKLPTLCLSRWAISAALLDELALALPHTHALELMDCFVSGEAWVRLLTLTSVTRLSISTPNYMSPPTMLRVALHEVTAFSASVPRAMTLPLGKSTLEDADVDAWDAFRQSLVTRRMVLGLPLLTIAQP